MISRNAIRDESNGCKREHLHATLNSIIDSPKKILDGAFSMHGYESVRLDQLALSMRLPEREREDRNTMRGYNSNSPIRTEH